MVIFNVVKYCYKSVLSNNFYSTQPTILVAITPAAKQNAQNSAVVSFRIEQGRVFPLGSPLIVFINSYYCLCDDLITRSEESYRLWCIVEGDLETS